MTTKIKNYPFKSALPQEFEIVDIGRHYASKKDILTSVHRTEFYQVLWFRQGAATHLVDFEPVEIAGGTLLFLNKGVINSFDVRRSFECTALIFTDSFFCKTDEDMRFLRESILFNDLFSVAVVRLGQDQGAVFRGLLESMEAELRNPEDRFRSDILKNHLHNLLLLAERERRRQGFTEVKKSEDLDLVLQLKELLEMHFRERRQVAFYTAAMHRTEKRLNQATTKVLGKTPKEIIDGRIMLEAKRILAHGSESIKEIGYALGFDEPTNFVKYFKKHASQTPLEFREATRRA